jgi:hypothetical protein
MLNNLEKARWNAAQTGIKHLGPILNEIYEAHDALVNRVAELEAQARFDRARIDVLEKQVKNL